MASRALGLGIMANLTCSNWCSKIHRYSKGFDEGAIIIRLYRFWLSLVNSWLVTVLWRPRNDTPPQTSYLERCFAGDTFHVYF
jgi:hypothetical protein